MRIGQMVTSYLSQAGQPSQGQSSTASGRSSVAQRANQARLTEASKSFLQATRVRDGAAAVSAAVGQASSLVSKAQEPALSATERKQMQSDFAKALSVVDQGAKEQTSAMADPKLANSTYKGTSTLAADQLGTGASQQFSSLADLKKLDLSTATSDQLVEAAKVLSAAQSSSKVQLARADAMGGQLAGRLNTLQNVQGTLAGTLTKTTSQQRDLAAIQALSQKGSVVTPGSLFYGIG
jgi:hypothetical protein